MKLGTIFLIRFMVVTLVFVAIFLILRKKGLRLSIKLDYKYIIKALKYSIPVLAYTSSTWIITACDRYMLGYFHNSVKVSYYSYTYSLINFIVVICGIIGTVLYPYIVESWNIGKKERVNFFFNAYLKYSLVILLPALAGLFVLRTEIATMLSGEKYLPALSMLPVMIFIPLIYSIYVMYIQFLMINDKTATVGWIFASGVILNICLNLILIPKYDMFGAAFAALLTHTFLLFMFIIKTHRFIKLNFSFIKIERIVLAVIIMALAIGFIHPGSYLFKILTICLGGAIYFVTLLVARIFQKEEIVLLKSFIPKKN